MATSYIPNATQVTQPTESQSVESAALEFRTLKAYALAAVTSLSTRTQALESALTSIGQGGLPGTVYVQRFTGTGEQLVFTLAITPQSNNVVDVYINGIYQNKDTFTVAGTAITFSEAPPVSVIEVQVTATVALGGTDAALVNFVPAGTGAMARTTESKLRERVSVADFGAVGDGGTDDTAAIQAALNTGKDVIFPHAAYRISAPLVVSSQRVIGGVGAKAINRPQSIIAVAGNHAAFVNGPGEVGFEIEGFFVDFGAAVPTDSVSAGNKVGFKFTTNGLWPAFSRIANCTVRGGWEGVYDDTGTYQSLLERVFAWNCRRGFFKQNGTTVKFDTCMAQGGRQGFWLKDVLSPTLINCAADQLTPTAAENTANYFEGIRSLSILGWDAESNVISGNELSYMRLVQTTGTITGFVGYLNSMSCAAGQEVYWFKADQGSRLTFSGCRVARNVGDLVFTGAAGSPMTLLAYDTCHVLLAASDFAAATGGTPTARYSTVANLVSTVRHTQSLVNNLQVGTAELASVESGTWTVGLNSFTLTGTPVLTGRYVRVGQECTCWVTINPNGGTVACTAGTSAISGLPFAPVASATCTATDNAVANHGVGIVSTTGLVYPPTWAASGNVKTVQFTYLVA